MLKTLSAVLLLLIFILPLSAQPGEYPGENEWFSFAVEQNGRPVEIKNSRVSLEKAPFTLVLITRGPLGMLVNCSASDTMFKGFLKDKPLEKIIAQPDLFMGIGEAPLNPDEMILVDKYAPHFLYYTDSASHRFSSTELRDGYMIGRRIISNYTTYAEEFRPIPIGEIESDTLYFSFLYGEWDEDYNRNELQKEAFKVIFTD